MVRQFGKHTTWMKWFSGKFITRGMLWWVVPLLVTLSSITWLRWGHNSFRVITLILLPTANLLSEVQHFFVGPPYPLGPHTWMQRAGCELSISHLVWEHVLESILCGYQRTTVVLFTLRMYPRWGFTVWVLCLKITWIGFSFYGCVISLNTVQFSRSVVSDSLQSHELQHARPPCPLPVPGVHPNPCPLSWWCHPAISSSVVPFSSCSQSFPASFQMSQLFASGGQSIGVSASTSVLPMNTQDWFPLGWTGCISLQSKGLARVFSNITVQKHHFFGAQLSL